MGTVKGNIILTKEGTEIIVADIAPTNPELNMLWLDTKDGKNILKRWEGSDWVIVNDIAIDFDEELQKSTYLKTNYYDKTESDEKVTEIIGSTTIIVDGKETNMKEAVSTTVKTSEENSQQIKSIETNYVTSETYKAEIENLQKQIDGAIETFSGDYEPNLDNPPASSWSDNDTKDKHIGDLFLVNSEGGTKAGFYYRFEKDNDIYKWTHIPDNEVQKALDDAKKANEAAKNAQDTADAISKNLTDNYSTTTVMDSKINQSKESIEQSVSATYSTKTEAQGYADTAEENAKSDTDEKLKSYSTTTEVEGMIDTKAGEISLEVSAVKTTAEDAKNEAAEATAKIDLKVDKDTLISEINASAEQVKISGDKIDIEGKVTFSSLDSNTQTMVNAGVDASDIVDEWSDTEDGNTVINGGKIKTNSITSNELNVTNIFGNEAVLSTLTSQEAFINAISTNSIVVEANNTANSANTKAQGIIDNIYTSGKTTIDGGKITTNSITSNELNVTNIFGNEAVLSTLTSQEAFINAISTNSIVVEANNTANSANTKAQGIIDNIYTSGKTTIDGGKITTNSIEADRLASELVLAQKVVAENLEITGGSVNVKTSSESEDVITLHNAKVRDVSSDNVAPIRTTTSRMSSNEISFSDSLNKSDGTVWIGNYVSMFTDEFNSGSLRIYALDSNEKLTGINITNQQILYDRFSKPIIDVDENGNQYISGIETSPKSKAVGLAIVDTGVIIYGKLSGGELLSASSVTGNDKINENDDLNVFIGAGTYYCTSGTIAKTLKNTPYTGGNFRLYTIVNTGNPMVWDDGTGRDAYNGQSSWFGQQILIATNDNSDIYARSHHGTNWSDWHLMSLTPTKHTQTSFTNFTGTRYADMISGKCVSLTYDIKPSKTIASGAYITIETLSSAWRPSHPIYQVFNVNGQAIQYLLAITTAGVVQIFPRAQLTTSHSLRFTISYIID